MNPQFKIHTPHSATRTPAGFTLIELLVVIGIIGILAALVVAGAGIATVNARKARVSTERDALVSAIENYKKVKGYYPPDNSNNGAVNSVTNSLYYELTGTLATGTPPNSFQCADGQTFNSGVLQLLFTLAKPTGFLNCSTDPNVPAQNFYPSLKNGQHLLVKGTIALNFSVLGINVPGPLQLNPVTNNVPPINPWHYVSSNPTNGPEFDLWMDVAWGGKTNRVSNWSKDPQVVY